jgi:exonuclease III
MRLASCNILGLDDGLTPTKVRNVAKIASRNAEVIGFQELKMHAEMEEVLAGLGPSWTVECGQTSTAIGLDTRYWEVLETGFSTLSPSMAKVTPQRYVAWVIAQSKKRPTLPPVAFTNGHLINKAWNDREKDPEIERIRRQYWNTGWEVWKAQVEELRNERNLTTFITGDFNRREVKRFHHRQEWLDAAGIDKIAYVPGPERNNAPKFEVLERWTVNTPSDHHVNAVRGRLLLP